MESPNIFAFPWDWDRFLSFVINLSTNQAQYEGLENAHHPTILVISQLPAT